ncbi:HamA C-terminal domain-containing protein [Maridesulfovibrio zosterae]|uniref:HamA C-terminal domain-containing protein n=1 Tax=Maridesulfovibrio zosterae TaxID=82171 RepID=UPI00042111D7|nr:DUF1837 domain-containing protein [Maridesulfovibrio zosterae]
MPIDEDKIEQLLSHTESFMNHVYWVQQEFPIQPSKNHCGVAINFNDINERRYDFLSELQKTVTSWVYSNAVKNRIFQERLANSSDLGNASEHLSSLARRKFRTGYPQGQFGELLLFNFIQYFFKAPPLLRKMPLATSSSHERFGADAIHYCKNETQNIIILGESKCYKSKYKFATAFKVSLSSLVDAFNSLDSELDLYTYDDFIDESLQDVAKSYKDGQLNNVRYELVCLIAYNETRSLALESEDQIKSEIMQIITDRCTNIEAELFEGFKHGVLNRMNYILFPIWDLDKLLSDFDSGR